MQPKKMNDPTTSDLSEDQKILDCSNNDDDEIMTGIISDSDNKQHEREKDLWKSSGWKIDQREYQVLGQYLLRIASFKIRSELDYDLYFSLVNFE